MTTDLSTCSETLAPALWSPSDRVRSRVRYEQPLTNYEKLHPIVVNETAAKTFRFRMPKITFPRLARKTRGTHANHPAPIGQQSRTHPGDVFYWVTCLGGASLLLLAATR